MSTSTDAATTARDGSSTAERPPDDHPHRTWEEWCEWRRAGLALTGLSVDSASTVDLTSPTTVIDVTGPEAVVSELRVRAESDFDSFGHRFVITKAVTIAAVAIVMLNIFDVITTKLALADKGVEGNPIAALFVYHLPIFVAIKVLLPGIVAIRIWYRRNQTTPMLLASMWWVVGVYCMTITINLLHVLA
jgi:hypothetical protein